MTGIFLDTFVNTHKYLDNENIDESDDQDQNIDGERRVKSNWEKYCDEEYKILSRQEEQQTYGEQVSTGDEGYL